MAQSFNQLTIVGRVGKAPEIRSMNNGEPVVNFSLAVTESWKSKDGEKKERTEWINCVCFNAGLCRVIEQYVDKGSLLLVQGKLQTRDWEKDGVKHYRTECVLQGFNSTLTMLDSRNDSGEREPTRDVNQDRGAGGHSFIDDEIPFGPETRA